MKDMNIASVLLRKRKEKGITQEDLARYMGVSKASVSKWETGTSFPDITFLPQLATYFDMSIDELLAYNPQLTKEDIRALRLRLSDLVDKRPFEETLEETRGIIKKYYSCYPLLMQMNLFLLNNLSATTDVELQQEVLREMCECFVRIREDSRDVALEKLALKMEAMCYLALGKPDTTLVLLEDLADEVEMPHELLVSSAYQQKGDLVEAKRSIQVGLYQNLAIQINYFSSYLMMVLDDSTAFEATIARADSCAQSFELDKLHPGIFLTYEMTKAMGLAQRGETSRCLEALECYTTVLVREVDALSLHGDAYFDLIEPWIENQVSGSSLPRSNAVTKHDLVKIVLEHPAFASLADDLRFKALAAKLQQLLKED